MPQIYHDGKYLGDGISGHNIYDSEGNLLSPTQKIQFNGATVENNNNRTIVTISGSGNNGNNLVLRTDVSKTNSVTTDSDTIWEPYNLYYPCNQMKLKLYDSFTLSFHWTTTNAPEGAVIKAGMGASGTITSFFDSIITFQGGETSGDVEVTKKLTNDVLFSTANTLALTFSNANGMSLTISKLKLEVGTEATPWVPNIMDFASLISDALNTSY